MPTVITQYTCDVCGTGFKAKGSATKCENKHKDAEKRKAELSELDDYVRLNTDGVESLKTNMQHVFDNRFPKAKLTVEAVHIAYKGLKKVIKNNKRPIGLSRETEGFFDYFEIHVKTSTKANNLVGMGHYPGSWQKGMDYWATYRDLGSQFTVFAADFPKLEEKLIALKALKKDKELERRASIESAKLSVSEDDVVIHLAKRVDDASMKLNEAREHYIECQRRKTEHLKSEYLDPLHAALAVSIQTLLPDAEEIGFDLDIANFSTVPELV